MTREEIVQFFNWSSYVSVLTIVAFSMERYLAICHPLHSYTMSGLKRATRIIAVLWITSLISASPFAIFTTINYLYYPPNTTDIATESAFCALLYLPEGLHLYEASGLLFFLAPMLVMMVLYARMGLRIRRAKKHTLGKGVRGSVHGEARQAQHRKPIIRML
ncbi:neuropeptides capa receptor-like, partial [Ctenocephalides felis]